MAPTVEQSLQTAIGLYQSGRLTDAEAACRRILLQQPDHAVVRNLLWAIMSALGRHREALELVLHAVATEPGNAAYHCDLGVIYRELGRFDEAVASHSRALALSPGSPEIHLKLADALHASGRLDDATTHLRNAIALRPDYASAHNNLGNVLMDQKQWAQAIHSYRCALAIVPDSALSHVNLGRALLKAGRIEDAHAISRRAVELQPDFADAHNILGCALSEKELLAEAIAEFRHAIELNRACADARANLGTVFVKMHDWERALDCYRQAIASRPDFVFAHCNLAIVLLLLGRYEEGWREYEWRWRFPGFEGVRRNFPAPRWDGSRADGRTILLHGEQGFGDNIQFARFVPLVQERTGGAVILECPHELERLFLYAGGWNARLVPQEGVRGSVLPHFDCHLTLLSLPAALRLGEPHHPAIRSAPYLCANPALREFWRGKIAPSTGLRVGIAWAGRPSHEQDRLRSIPFAQLTTILRIPGVSFYSLQLTQDSAQSRAMAEAGVLDLTAHIADFADTAALMAELDLIITVDTAAAHLAGAIGRPVWTLLQFVPDWRWGLEREDTPWYPSMKLFRQAKAGEWDPVIRRVAEELSALQTVAMGN